MRPGRRAARNRWSSTRSTPSRKVGGRAGKHTAHSSRCFPRFFRAAWTKMLLCVAFCHMWFEVEHKSDRSTVYACFLIFRGPEATNSVT